MNTTEAQELTERETVVDELTESTKNLVERMYRPQLHGYCVPAKVRRAISDLSEGIADAMEDAIEDAAGRQEYFDNVVAPGVLDGAENAGRYPLRAEVTRTETGASFKVETVDQDGRTTHNTVVVEVRTGIGRDPRVLLSVEKGRLQGIPSVSRLEYTVEVARDDNGLHWTMAHLRHSDVKTTGVTDRALSLEVFNLLKTACA